MKRFKKMMALVIATMMIAMYAVVPSFAAGTGQLTVDDHIAVTGLKQGDKVNFYQVFKWDGDWVEATGFDLTDTEFATVKGTNTTMGTISSEVAAKLRTQSSTATVKYANVTADASGKANVANPEAGLYIAIITAGEGNTTIIYNPVFVAADYSRTSGDPDTNEWNVTTELSYSDTALAKKSEITVDKTASDQKTVDTGAQGEAGNYDNKSETVSVGDTVDFKVDTTIPKFSSNYTAPAFTVTDKLSAGLEYQNDAKVYVITTTETTTTDPETGDDVTTQNEVETELKATSSTTTTDPETGSPTTTTTTVYTLTPNGTIGYTVNFDSNYLKGLTADQKIRIKYTAKVTSDAPTSYNKEDNTVVVSFSNNPNDTSSRTKVVDKTNHYTFDIDGNILLPDGEVPWSTTEVVKVGVDKNGVEISETVVLNGTTQQKAGSLEGAEFELYTDSGLTTRYTNDILTAGKKIVSDSKGRLTIQGETTPGIRGLDAGTYYLKETKAPDGYIKAQDAIKIEIIPTFEEKEETIVDGSDTLKVKVLELKSYTIKIADLETANYTITHSADGTAQRASAGDNIVGATPLSSAGKIKNTKGVELPSTGGMGTTLFYIIGAILIIGAGVLLVTRRRTESAE